MARSTCSSRRNCADKKRPRARRARMKFNSRDIRLILTRRVRRNLLALLAVVVLSPSARAKVRPLESGDVLHFMQKAEAVYVFPVTNPSEPRRNDKHLRLLGTKARQQLRLVLAEPRNW